MNKSYCGLLFNEIYSDNKGCYNLCCMAQFDNHLERKFKTKDVTPFEFYLSEDMNEIREKALKGERIESCKRCYDEEETIGYSKRLMHNLQNRNIPPPTSVGDVTLKLRFLGNACNLSCISCWPYNSSTKEQELKQTGLKDHFPWSYPKAFNNNNKEWEFQKKDILENIDKISCFHMIGGEPLVTAHHWQLLMEDISDDDAKNISLKYNTNLTTLSFKDYTLDDLFKKYKDVNLLVSSDHFGDKLHFMRYPIDVEEFENNLFEVHDHVSQIACTVQLLNILEIDEIREYYETNFKIPVDFGSYVVGPTFMSIKNLPLEIKKELIEKHEYVLSGSPPLPRNLFVHELKKRGKHRGLIKGMEYLDTLGKHRGIDWRKLWGDVVNV